MKTRPSSLEDMYQAANCVLGKAHIAAVSIEGSVCVCGEPLRGKVSRKHLCVLFYRQVVVFTFFTFDLHFIEISVPLGIVVSENKFTSGL